MAEAHEQNSRREFLKKAGTVAWVVPTVQVINMAAASAGVDGSVVTTSPPSTTEVLRCYCEVVIQGYHPIDDGFVFTVCVHISDGCTTADNVTLSVENGFEFNTGIQPCYDVEVDDNNLGALLTVEIHDNTGEVLTTCHTTLDVEV